MCEASHSRQFCGYFRNMKPHIVSTQMFRGESRRCLTSIWFSRLLSLFLISEKSRHIVKKKRHKMQLKRNREKEQLIPNFFFLASPGILLSEASWLIFVHVVVNFLNFAPITFPVSASRNMCRAILHRSFFEVSKIGCLIIDKVRVSTIKTNIMLPILHHQL